MVAAHAYGLNVLSVDLIGTFVRRAQKIADRLSIPNLSFKEADLFDVSWAGADILYLTATTFSDENWARVEEKCVELKKGSLLISLTRSPKSSVLENESMAVLDFSWGPATVFLSRRL